jgi:hypothetical protein
MVVAWQQDLLTFRQDDGSITPDLAPAPRSLEFIILYYVGFRKGSFCLQEKKYYLHSSKSRASCRTLYAHVKAHTYLSGFRFYP